MELKNIKTKQELEEFANELIGEGKECEKNLFTALYLFLKDFVVESELDLEHMLSLTLATKLPRGMRNDPYPVRPESWYGEKENRCCADCNYTIVIPVRFRCGRHAQQHVARLREMDYKELSAFVADMGIRFPIINPRMLTYVPTTCKSSVAKAISL